MRLRVGESEDGQGRILTYTYLVIAVIVVAAAAIGLLFFMRHRQRELHELASGDGAARLAEPDGATHDDPTPEAVEEQRQDRSPEPTVQAPTVQMAAADGPVAGNQPMGGQPAATGVAGGVALGSAIYTDSASSNGGTGAGTVDPPDPWLTQALSDPLSAVLVNMLSGPGKLTGSELKRLDVFRPERIKVALELVEPPAGVATQGDVVERRAQIELYASTMELRAKWATQMRHTTDSRIPQTPLSAYDFKLKMARDIMSLPAPDRTDVIAFLLGGLLQSHAAPELKRAVMDTLDHLNTAVLVNVLLDCLDSPDPIVQEYALAAADRLLEE
jgi:hypothetical protein